MVAEDSDSSSVGDDGAAPLVLFGVSPDASAGRILRMLQSDDLNLKLKTANEVRGRTTTASLVRMLGSTSVVAKKAGLDALLNLAVQDERNMILTVNGGALKLLTEFLMSENPVLQEHAASALVTLSASSINKPVMGASGFIPLLVRILRNGPPEVMSDALAVLHNLSSHKENLMQLLQAEPIPPLVNMIKHSRRSSRTSGTSTALIEILMGFEEARTALISEEGGILSVVEVLECGSLQNRGSAVGALLTMCQSDRSKYREPILREGVVPGLLELTVQGTPKSRAKAQLLLNLLRESPSPNFTGLEPDAVDNIVFVSESQIDVEEMSGRRSKQMFSEMVQLSMELSFKRIQNHALVLASSDPPVNDAPHRQTEVDDHNGTLEA